MKSITYILILLFSLVFCDKFQAQKKQVNWITFQQLEDSLATNPKKVFINFHADWCAYCKKMDKATFKNEKVISLLNSKYYTVKMNVESKDSVYFDGKFFINKEIGKNRNPTHEIPLLFGKKNKNSFTLPLNLILTKKFKVESKFIEYISPKKMIKILED